MRKKILSIVLAVVMSLTLFTGCSLFEYDAERDYKQVVATIDAVEITETTGAEKKSFTTEAKKIYKYELMNSISALDPSVFQSYGVEEVIDILINQLVQRQLVLNAADAQLAFGNIVWGVNEENQVREGIFGSIDAQLATIRNEILLEHGESVADMSDSQENSDSTETTYPVLEEKEVGLYDDYSKDELVVEASNKMVAYEEVKKGSAYTETEKTARLATLNELYGEYSKTKLVAIIENLDLQDAKEWTPALTRYPGLYGTEEVRSLEIEAMRRFINMMSETIEEDYRISSAQRKTFRDEIKNMKRIADEKGVSYVYPEIGKTQFMDFIVGKTYRDNVKLELLEAHITDKVDVREEEVQESYNQLLAEQKAKYDASLDAFHTDMSGGNVNIVYYPTSNYYYVKHILVPFSDAQTAQLNEYKNGTGKLLGDEAIKEFKENLGKQVKGFEHRDGENYGKPLTIDAIYADIERTMAAAQGSLEACDKAFEKLIYKYNTDDGIFGNELGYAVKAVFANGEEYDTTYMEEFSRAADELYRNGVEGVISQPAVTDYGVHILYLSKIPTAGTTLGLNDYFSYGKKNTVFDVLEEELRSAKIQDEFYEWQSKEVGYYLTTKKIVTTHKKAYQDIIDDAK